MAQPDLQMDEAAALELANRISAWLKERIEEAGSDRFVLGLSGGIDSAVTAAIAVAARQAIRAVDAARSAAVDAPPGRRPASRD